MAQVKPSIPKGTRDFSPVEMAKRNYIFNTIKDEKMSHFDFLDYASHAITDGSDSQGVAYIHLRDRRNGKDYWGVGLSSNINLAPLRAILSAINRSWVDRHSEE